MARKKTTAEPRGVTTTTISITVPTAAIPRILAAYVGMAGRTDLTTQADQAAFARSQLYADIRAKVLAWEAMQADNAAAANPTDPINIDPGQG